MRAGDDACTYRMRETCWRGGGGGGGKRGERKGGGKREKRRRSKLVFSV